MTGDDGFASSDALSYIGNQAPLPGQVEALGIRDWTRKSVLANLYDSAGADDRDKLSPKVVSDVMKSEGHYVVAPVNAHRVNWMWNDLAAFEQAGADIPAKREAFVVAAKTRDTGFIPWHTQARFR